MLIVCLEGKKELEAVCEKYWQYDPAGGFLYGLEDLEWLYGACFLESQVAQSCCAYYSSYVCDGCGEPLKYFRNRSEFLQERDGIETAEVMRSQGRLVLCAGCSKNAPVNLNHLEIGHPFTEEQLAWMEGAFHAGAYEGLEPAEFDLLKALACSDHYADACRLSGLAGKWAENALMVLALKHLIAFSEQAAGYYLLPRLLEALVNYAPAGNIFGDVKKEELYRVLKARHGFVFPGVKLSSFIDAGRAEHMLEGARERRLFHLTRVDFLICDRYGIPRRAVEHCSGAGEKENFKEKVLKAAGIAVERYTSRDLLEEKSRG